jgi:DNA-binding PadR family transcriptional regulator
LGVVGGVGHDLVDAWLVLLLAKGPRHGYQLADDLRSYGVMVVDHSYVYRALRKLEDLQLAESDWDFSATRRSARRVYHLTAAGEVALDEYACLVAVFARRLCQYGDEYRVLR